MKHENRYRPEKGYIQCDYCGELFVEGEPFCPCCGKPVEEILRDINNNRKRGQARGYKD